MKNFKNNALTSIHHWNQSVQKILAMALVMCPWLLPLTANADIADAAKTSGSKVSGILFIVLVVVGGVCLLIGFIMHATGSQQLAQKGQTRIMYALFGIGGGLLVGLFLTWIYQTATSAGGGNFLNWPF